MGYFLAPALVRLRAEINALWPGRDKVSDGWIGDAAHNARKSDHNPDYSSGGIVRAIDVDKDNIPVESVVEQVRRDPRVAYIIWNGRIWENPSAYPGRGYWRAYTGANAHRQHFHVSVRHGARWDRDGSSWGLTAQTSAGGDLGSSLPSLPDLTPIAPIEEAFMPALTDEEQRRLLEAADAIRLHLMHMKGRVDATHDYARDTTARTQVIRAQGENITNGVSASLRTLQALAKSQGVKIDEAEIARELAPLLIGSLGSLSDEDVQRIAQAAADVQAERLSGRA